MPTAKNLRTCDKGHHYYKSTGCPACPICEQESKPADGLLSLLGAPARRALENAGILSVEALSQHSRKDILKLHGIGPASIPLLEEALRAKNLAFRK